MIGITFSTFLSLFVVGAICALLLHNMLKPALLGVADGYLSQLIIGWLGAWLGSPVVGHWGWNIPSTNVYLVPAALGSLAGVVSAARAATAGPARRMPGVACISAAAPSS